ncbi:Aste57867_13168 [Aphanomyces stellatus]|uniref:Aste57867_13168 protein n=1 Tax=Aphanomyces stellatus TaxID=120398 RepID=A0A485KXG1_9STRA|nr:hypothetical protein As57867_013119 [Aphanomyces stellatus]VFT90009.1 Aste57867_13168 [Aphanomyces stellatus]
MSDGLWLANRIGKITMLHPSDIFGLNSEETSEDEAAYFLAVHYWSHFRYEYEYSEQWREDVSAVMGRHIASQVLVAHAQVDNEMADLARESKEVSMESVAARRRLVVLYEGKRNERRAMALLGFEERRCFSSITIDEKRWMEHVVQGANEERSRGAKDDRRMHQKTRREQEAVRPMRWKANNRTAHKWKPRWWEDALDEEDEYMDTRQRVEVIPPTAIRLVDYLNAKSSRRPIS